MTRLVIFYILILLLCFNFFNVLAQKVIIKDATNNTLIQINDEGTFGSITIPDSIGAPPVTTNKLYNVNGTLNFNGTALGATGATDINGLSDGKTAGNSVYLGNGAGTNDVKTINANTAVGVSTLYSNTTGNTNTATGFSALYSNTTGSFNIANGHKVLYSNISGNHNIAIGDSVLYYNTVGNGNTAAGTKALFITRGNENTAFGRSALSNNYGSRAVAVGYQSQQHVNNLISTPPRNNYNTSVGYQSLRGSNSFVNTGSYNSAFGYQALYSNATGHHNTAIGDSTLYSNIYGINNVAVGSLSLYENISGKGNTAVGKEALSTSMGNRNTAIGRSALSYNYGSRAVAVGYQSQQYVNNLISTPPSNNYNTSVGYQSLRGSNSFVNTGSYNSAFGYQALYLNATGHHNTAIGDSALYSNIYGYHNIAIGSLSLFNNISGHGNIVIGYQAGYNVTGSNKLFIDNSSTSKPLIWGSFSGRMIVINGNATSNSNNRTFFSNGAAGGTTAWFNDSDRRLKKNISTIPNALKKIKKLRGVNYQWKNTEHRSEGTKMGFIAQEAIKVIPEVVDMSNDHYSMQYAPITALLVEAVKEQNTEFRNMNIELKERIEKLEKENQNLKTVINENNNLKNEITVIKAALNKLITEKYKVKVSSK